MRLSRWIPTLWLGLASVAHAAPAQDQAMAEALFREGKELALAGDHAGACRKFEASFRLDSALGTLLHMATCHEQTGKTATAWLQYSQARRMAERAGDSARSKLAAKRMADIERRLSRLAVIFDADAPRYQVRLNGRPMTKASLGVAVPLDPGEHQLQVLESGRVVYEKTVNLPSGPASEQLRIVLPARPVSAEPAARAAAPAGATRESAAERDSKSSNPPLLGYVGLGAGAVALGVGAVFGLRARSFKSSADEHCKGNRCNQAGLDDYEAAQSSALVADVAFAVGAVCLVAGTVIVLSSDSKPAADSATLRLGVAGRRDAPMLDARLSW